MFNFDNTEDLILDSPLSIFNFDEDEYIENNENINIPEDNIYNDIIIKPSYNLEIYNLLNYFSDKYFNINNDKSINNYISIIPDNENYQIAYNNFINNSNLRILENHKILINNIWFYINKNHHSRISIFAYPNGFENLNNQNIYPLLTAPFQINTLKECKNHNEKYNNKFYTQIVIINNIEGNKFINHKHSFTAHFANTETEALIQIIYILSEIYKLIKEFHNIENIISNNITYDVNEDIKYLLDRNIKRFFEKYKKYILSFNI